MFKRLSKGRRHSADEVGCSLPSVPGNIDETLQSRKSLEGQIQAINTALMRVSRNKYARRSCGDTPTMQSLLASVDERSSGIRPRVEADYQTVTAVPAFIVEHEPEKQQQQQQQRGLGVWGRRMSKKIESFRRAGSRESICSSIDRSDNDNNNNDNANNNNDRINCPLESNKNPIDHFCDDKNIDKKKIDTKTERKFLSSNRSPSPFKSFFIRMGSTGMLNSTRANRRSANLENTRNTPEKENLFRSCSTSHLNTSPTYVKGDDPSDGIDLQIGNRKDRTLSCDDLAARQIDEDFYDNNDDKLIDNKLTKNSSKSFRSCDIKNSTNEPIRKSNSCDFKDAKKSNFPYAFLRSKLSVLPEEKNQQQNSKDERLFKATSEENFPIIKIDESFDGTTTLGRRKTKNFHHDNAGRYNRNSYAEFGENRNFLNFDKFYNDNLYKQDEHLSGLTKNRNKKIFVGSLHRLSENDKNYETSEEYLKNFHDRRLSENSTINVDIDVVATLRNQRRNSAPNTEQRLSSHYVSSNESGYDSDGPRGESTGVSENEAASLKFLNTDSSDTSSVIDSEIEKPMRSSTPNEFGIKIGFLNNYENNYNIDGLRWHQQSNSGRILPSIHQSSCTSDDSMTNRFSRCTVDNTNFNNEHFYGINHRDKLQQDKTKFFNDIVQNQRKIRRCRIVQLDKRDERESLGIRLAQQQSGELRYIVVQLENGGIAHRDGRLRLGDEIVEVEGKELKTLESLAEVQEYLKSFKGNTIRLTTAYEETLPEVFNDDETSKNIPQYESNENVKNLSSLPSTPVETPRRSESSLGRPASRCDDNIQLRNVPENLSISSKKNRKDRISRIESTTESQQYMTKHLARFEKGYGKPSLGFSVVGGRDSPRGEMGIFVRRVFPGGQADVSKSLFQGDEILNLNGKVLRGYTHQEVIELFKAVREGPVELELARRHRYPRTPLKSAPY